MLLMLLEKGEEIADIVFFDTGWEFPQMYDHLEKLEIFTGRKITRLQARLPIGIETEKTPFDWFFSEAPIAKRGTDQIHKIGRGWPAATRRWCTTHKRDAITSHFLALTHKQGIKLPLRQCIGFAADESQRVVKHNGRCGKWVNSRFPLVEWGITEAEALKYCRKAGFSWNGLYKHFSRVSCFCCPFQRIGEYRTLRSSFPELWEKILLMESWLSDGFVHHYGNTTVPALDNRFAKEESI